MDNNPRSMALPLAGWVMTISLCVAGGGGAVSKSRFCSRAARSTTSSGGSGPWSDLKTSMRLRSGGQDAAGACPPSRQISASTTPGGRSNGVGGWPSSVFSITSCQIGAAPVMPDTSFIGELSLLPTHTPTASSGV